MKKTIAYVDGKAINGYKSDKCFCGCDCDEPDIYTDKTTNKKYVIGVDNGQLYVEEYVEPSDSSASDVVGTAIVGKSKAA